MNAFRSTNLILAVAGRTFSERRALKSTYGRLVGTVKDFFNPKPPDPPYKHVCVIGDPVLRAPVQQFPMDKPDQARKLIDLLRKVMKEYGACGLAASQIGVPLAAFVMELPEGIKKHFSKEVWAAREMQPIPFTAAINPVMRVLDNTVIKFPESCESMKGYSAVVPRFYKVSLKAYNENLEPFELEATGWTSRVIQHEMDHLQGVLITDKMDAETLQYAKWHLVNCRKGKYKQKMYGKYL